MIKQFNEVRNVKTGHRDDYKTDFLLDDAYFKDSYKLIAVDLSKQKALDADPRVIQQIVLLGFVGGDDSKKVRLYAILEQAKETILEFYKWAAKVL